MSETLDLLIQNDKLEDSNALKIEVVDLNGVNVRLISCDHQPEKMPKKYPWGQIEDEIKDSSLVFVEYFPHELEQTVYNNPIWGKLARVSAKVQGIDQFFGRVSDICVEHDREIAVADIANGAKYSAYYSGLRNIPGLLPVIISPGEMGTVLTVAGLVYGQGMNVQEFMRIGAFDLERKGFERFVVDIEDARRLLTARGIQQEAERRIKGSNISYIAPRAHVSRVKWYLENPDDIPTKVKSKVYSFTVGLPKSTRIYKYSHVFHSWHLVSDIPTKT